ncbi:PepSY-associated TM helix domain-containing protein [Bdellovibrio bacteriovorus]|uniref:PepSY-associated TM helix domain-containing protein n=1 Tax=Bdellovibrio bacteriovorus TaxID=959 RepID=UPI0035A5AD24
MKRLVRKTMLWAHRWLGLIVGFHFVLLGLSGSYLVYADEIESVFKRDLKIASQKGDSVPLDKIVESAKNGLETNIDPMRILIGDREARYNHTVMFNIPKGEEKRRFVRAYVDAATFEFKGADVYKETLTGFLFVFHHDLFSGPTGRTITAVTGVLSLLILLGGLYLWWPHKGKSWKRALRYNRQRSFLGLNLELHKVIGFYSLVLMIIVTFSGIYVARSDWFFPRKTPTAAAPGREAGVPLETLSFAHVQPGLNALFAGDEVEQLRIDTKTGLLQARARNDAFGISGWEWKLTTGELLATKYKKDRNFEQKFGDLQRSWHFGNFWGELGRFLIFVSGLLPLFFWVTGFYVWRKK